MKTLSKIIAFGLLGLSLAANAVQPQSASLLNPSLTFLRLTNGFGATNLNYLNAYGIGAATNVSQIEYITAYKPNVLYITVTTNITTVGATTNVMTGYTNTLGDGWLSNILVSVTTVTSTNVPLTSSNATATAAVLGSTYNLLSQTDLPHNTFAGLEPATAAYSNTTNAWGTLSFTTLSAGSNTCVFTFAPTYGDPLSSSPRYIDTDGRNQWSVTVTNAAWPPRTTGVVLPALWPGAQGIALISIYPSVAGAGGAVQVLDVRLNQIQP